jgi:hypothetical protein
VAAILDMILDRIMNRASAVRYTPIFDNALKHNDLLQRATVVASFTGATDLATDGTQLFVSDHSSVFRLDPDGCRSLAFDLGQPITAIACHQGGVACALAGREIRIVGGAAHGWSSMSAEGPKLHSANALWSAGAALLATDGSETRETGQWRHDLMERGQTGRVFSLSPSSNRVSVLASGLNYAFGAASLNGETLVSESWAHRLMAIDARGRARVVLADLPVYPSRLATSEDGAWLTAFCVRSDLVEFVLREDAYRRQMIGSIDPDLWISPQLRSFAHVQEPVQQGALSQMGAIKPWAPARSYGLVIKLDQKGAPTLSLQSRMGGRHHGITAAAELAGELYLLSQGDQSVIRLNIAEALEDFNR